MKFREHRGGLDESMATCVEVADRAALVSLIRRRLAEYHYGFEDHLLKVQAYAKDERIGWPDTHIVTIDGYGVVGFTDGPVDGDAVEPTDEMPKSIAAQIEAGGSESFKAGDGRG